MGRAARLREIFKEAYAKLLEATIEDPVVLGTIVGYPQSVGSSFFRIHFRSHILRRCLTIVQPLNRWSRHSHLPFGHQGAIIATAGTIRVTEGGPVVVTKDIPTGILILAVMESGRMVIGVEEILETTEQDIHKREGMKRSLFVYIWTAE